MKRIPLLLASLLGGAAMAQTIDLSGQWQFSLNPDNGFTETICLPGTMDENHKGTPNTDTHETTRLTRRYSYAGKAWYRRTISIPKHKGWQRENVWLTLERTKPATVYVDGDSVSYSDDISTPQAHNLGQLKPGDHVLTIVVDNAGGIPRQLYESSHAICEDTQTNWNGIIGNMRLSWVKTWEPLKVKSDGSGMMPVSAIVPYDDKPCFRNFHIEGQHFYADGHKVYLRGKHDACVWPLTGYCPMDVGSWLSYMQTLREYGINHLRFHSWCPPDAAFAAADSLGFYLQPELPFWGKFDDKDTTLMAFLRKEGERIISLYGWHPSFVMFALGNELRGSIDKMKEFVDLFRQINPNILYTFGSNYYLGYQGVKPGMDYFTTCRVGGEGWGNYTTHTRGSFAFADVYDGGIINHFHPNTVQDFEEACSLSTVPIISHETGQFQSYPDYNEIAKYDSTIFIPYNLMTFRDRLSHAGMLSQAADFHRASGRWAWLLYKADIEMDLRTANMAGFQLLDLQDYPGQGSAYVGVLDAFMQSKGYGTAEEWRQFCAPVVPLLVAPKFCYEAGDTIKATVEVANYSGESLKGKALEWSIDDNSVQLAKGEAEMPDSEGMVAAVANIDVPVIGLIEGDSPRMVRLKASVAGTDYTNSWQMWLYPDKPISHGSVVETSVMTADIISRLERGATVLWSPDSAALAADTVLAAHTVGGLFMTDYWNYRMFKTICEKNHRSVSPGTLGILTDPRSPLFKEFPTEEHSNWQWWPMTKMAHPIVLDAMPAGYKPIVQVIDNIERNHKLGLVAEWRVGKGRLLMAMSDLRQCDQWPEGRAFHRSLLSYMQSAEFQPATSYATFAQLYDTITSTQRDTKLERLDNISEY